MSRAFDSVTNSSPVPSTFAIHHSGWVPVIHGNPEIETFRHKIKPTAAAAIDYARRVIHYRHIREQAHRRHLEILQGNLLRQTKLSPDEAMTVAERVWRTNRQLAEKRARRPARMANDKAD